MTYTMGASGTVDEVRNALTMQAENYAEELVGHVKDLVHKVLDTIAPTNRVTASVSGHTGPDGFTASINVTPTMQQSPTTTPPPDPAPVS